MAADPFALLNRVLDSRHTQPGAIRKACMAVEDCIVNNRDNLRGFFDKCFPNLLKRIFGYDDFEASWLNMVTKPHKEEDARALVNLLHPQGKLFAAMHRADSESLIRYIFPVERLPGHTQALLATASGRKQLEEWPQYKDHIVGPEQSAARRTQVFLDVFTYYMFWTAFYVLRGNRAEEGGRGATFGAVASPYRAAGGGAGGGTFAPHQPWGLSELRRFGSTFIPGLGQGGGAPLSRHPYYTLLRLYLEHFLPAAAAGAAAPGASGAADDAAARAAAAARGASGGGAAASAPGGSGNGGGGASGPRSTYGRIILNVLLEFWLTDVAEPVPSDAQPGPGSVGGVGTADKGSGAAAGAAAGGPGGAAGALGGSAASLGSSYRTMSYQPPSEDLVEALIHLVRYITILEPSPGSTASKAYRAAGVPGVAGGAPVAGAPRQAAAVERVPAQSKQVWLPDVAVKTRPPLPSPRLLSAPPPGSLLTGPSAVPPVQLVSRKLYRFLRRTLTQWPLSSSASLTPVITLWLSVIAPWSPRLSGAMGAPAPSPPHPHHSLLGLHTSGPRPAPGPGGAGGSPVAGAAAAAGPFASASSAGVSGGYAAAGGGYGSPTAGAGVGSPGVRGAASGGTAAAARNPASYYGKYTPAWRQHVLSHLPFYTILVPKFLELTYSRQSFRSDAALCDLLLLLEPLAASPELVQELQAAEAAVQSYLAGGAGAARRPSDGGQSREFAAWAVEQACDWEAAAVAGMQLGSGGLQVDPSYRLFSSDTRGAASFALAVLRASEAQLVAPELRAAVREAATAILPLQGAETVLVQSGSVAGVGAPPAPDLGLPRQGHWQSLQYHGDPLWRPIASNEIGPLVRLLVVVSDRLNRLFGLSKPLTAEEESEPPESVGQQAVRWLRRRHYRINLRFLAEKQTLLWLLLLYFVYRLFFAAPAAAPGGLAAAPAPHQHQQQYSGYQHQQQQHNAYQQQQQQQHWQAQKGRIGEL